jgi:hypothetical protein
MSRWSDLDAAKGAVWRAKGHTALMQRAAQLIPMVSDEDASRLRAAMLTGVGGGLHELVSELNLRVA